MQAIKDSKKVVGQADEGVLKKMNCSKDFFQTSPSFFMSISPEGRTICMSEEILQLLGYTIDDVVGKDYLSTFIPVDQRSRLSKIFKRLAKSHQQIFDENRLITKDGEELIVKWQWWSIFGPDNKLDFYFGVGSNITELIRSEEALKKNEIRYRVLAEHVTDVVWAIDMDLRFFYISPSITKLLGYRVQDVLGYPLEKIVTAASLNMMKNALSEFLALEYMDEESLCRTRTLELELKHKEGFTILTENKMEFIYDSERRVDGILMITRDIRKRRQTEKNLQKAYNKLQRLQDQLIQAEKMSAIGELASGIAHEIKNPLSILINGIEYLEDVLTPQDEETCKILRIMKESVNRTNDTIHSLLDFARNSELDLRSEDINPILKDSLILAKQGIKYGQNIDIVMETKQDIPKALVDKNKMKQILINLFLNAFHAMPKGGKIIVRSYETQLNEFRNGVGRRSADYFNLGERAVIVEIEDKGIGISKENLKRIFNPFFTTKPPGEGVGLGLSVTRNLINMHKGLIDVKSQKGKGTTFIIILKIAGESDDE